MGIHVSGARSANGFFAGLGLLFVFVLVRAGHWRQSMRRDVREQSGLQQAVTRLVSQTTRRTLFKVLAAGEFR